MNEELKKKLEEFENETGNRIVYVTKYGSKLYGTDNEFSDTDYKGIFVPMMDDILLKKDLEHWTSNTNNTNEKNSVDDVDLQLISLHMFFNLLRKGETGAIDILFSMWSDSVEFIDPVFEDHIKMYYKKFLNRRLHSFTGYAVGQSKKYGIKGTRYKELSDFVQKLDTVASKTVESKLGYLFPVLEEFVSDKKYINFVEAPGPKTGKGDNTIVYLEVLGKKFSGDVTVGYFYSNVNSMFEQFGNRTKASVGGTDWKALSHALRVLLEVEELIDTGFIKFPLKDASRIKEVKEGKVELEEVMEQVNSLLDTVKNKIERCALPEESDRETMDWIELFLIHLYNKDV